MPASSQSMSTSRVNHDISIGAQSRLRNHASQHPDYVDPALGRIRLPLRTDAINLAS